MNVKIELLHTRNMRNDMFFMFYTKFRELVEEFNPARIGIAAAFAAFVVLYDKLDAAFKRVNKSALTEKIQDADKARDMIWAGMMDVIAAALKDFDPEVRDAAKKLRILFKAYGNVPRKSLTEQTSATINILQDLEGKYANEVEITGLRRWVTELKARNNDFRGLVKDRFDESAAKCDVVLKKARVELDASYRMITDRINALITVEGADNYEAFVKALNTVIKKYANAMAIAKGRSAAKKARKTEDDGEE